MTLIYSARWVLPISSPPIENGAIAVEGEKIVAVGDHDEITSRFPDAQIRNYPGAAILPGLINAHSHLELTAMRGFLDNEEGDFFAWLKKLTLTRLTKMTPDDLYVSATWGACEALRAGVTCVGDASSAGYECMRAIRDVGLRGTVFQESFGPDARLAEENVATLKQQIERLREIETSRVRAGVSPHAPYTVSAPQLKLISQFAIAEDLPVMMHAAESAAEDLLLREGQGIFASGLAARSIEWKAPAVSPIQYLKETGVLETHPLLAHCIRVGDDDIETIAVSGAGVAHCPKSNAKLGHGRAPLIKFLEHGVNVGLGSDSVASNNTCDLLEEARFATLLARMDGAITADEVLKIATMGGARALKLEGQVGELKPEMQADLAVISLAGVHQSPSYDPINTLVFASSGRDVILTVVAGSELYREGRITTLNENDLRHLRL